MKHKICYAGNLKPRNMPLKDFPVGSHLFEIQIDGGAEVLTPKLIVCVDSYDLGKAVSRYAEGVRDFYPEHEPVNRVPRRVFGIKVTYYGNRDEILSHSAKAELEIVPSITGNALEDLIAAKGEFKSISLE